MHILPRTVQLYCLDQNTPFRMGINGTYQIWPVQFLYGRTGHFWKILIANYRIWKPTIEKIQFPVHILPRTVQLCCLDQNTPFKMGINGTYQIWPVQFVYGRTGDFEVCFSIANIGPPLKKFNFQCTYFPGLYSYAVWTKTHLSRWESMVIPDLTCTVRVRPHRSLWRILYS